MILIHCIRFWGGKIITWFMGFNNFAMEKVENDIESIINYREVGFRVDSGKQFGAINAFWRMWQPNIGFGSTMGLVISLCLLFSLIFA